MADGALPSRHDPRRLGVAKPEWGAKRICHNCGARYYDLQRDSIPRDAELDEGSSALT